MKWTLSSMCCQPPGHYERTCLNVEDGHFSNPNKTTIFLLTQSPCLNMQTLQAGRHTSLQTADSGGYKSLTSILRSSSVVFISAELPKSRISESRHIYILDKYYHWVCSWLAGLLTRHSINIITITVLCQLRGGRHEHLHQVHLLSLQWLQVFIVLHYQKWKDTTSRR